MSIISMKTSIYIPLQSICLPLISLYYTLSLSCGLFSFIWFILIDKLKTKKIKSIFGTLKSESGDEKLIDFLLLEKIIFIFMFLNIFLFNLIIWIQVNSN
jgi:hypothetical protein